MLGRSAIVKCCTRNDTATPQTCANADTAAHVLCDAYVVPAHGTLAVDGTNQVAWRVVVMEDLEYSMVRHRAGLVVPSPPTYFSSCSVYTQYTRCTAYTPGVPTGSCSPWTAPMVCWHAW